MAKPPTFNLKQEDFASLLEDYPEFESLIRNLNRFATSVNAALNKGTTFEDNIASQSADVTFDTDATPSVIGVPLKIALKLPAGRKPKHVTITRAVIVDPATRKETAASLVGPAWSIDGDKLAVSGFGLLTGSTRYRVTLLIVGG